MRHSRVRPSGESANDPLMAQLELFAQPSVAVSTVPTVEEVRTRLDSVLHLLRAASKLPWSRREADRWELIFPQMTDWLPENERETARNEFAALMERLKAKPTSK